MNETKKNPFTYAIQFDIPKPNSGISSTQFFQSIQDCLVGFEELNNALANGISKELQVISYIEDVERGSIKIWLRDVLRDRITDDDIRDVLAGVPIPGLQIFLIKAKKLIVYTLNKKIPNEEKSKELIKKLEHEANHLGESKYGFPEIKKDAVLSSISKISQSTKNSPKTIFIDSQNNKTQIKGGYIHNNEDEKQVIEPQQIITHLTVYSPKYEDKATKWGFYYNGKHQYMNIQDSGIWEIVEHRGGALIGDVFKVQLEITEYITQNKEYKQSYKILKVLDFIPAPRQQNLNFN